MCYYSSISVGFKIIEDRFGAKFIQTESFVPIFSASAFTCPAMPVITNANPKKIELYHWGLIPFWVKDNKDAGEIKTKTLNARSETIFQKPAFRHAILSRRCLVLADGFFEWRRVNNKRYPYYIRLSDHQPFAMAGIWDRWQDRELDCQVRTFSIITTEANALVAQIHNVKKRMPVILTRENEERWLDNNLDKGAIESMLYPYDPGKMEAHTIDRAVSRLGTNTNYPEVLIKKDYPELPPLVPG